MPLLLNYYRTVAKIQTTEQKGYITMGLLKDICKAENIKLIGFTEELSNILTSKQNFTGQGQAIAQEGEKYVIFDNTASLWERCFIVAHEVAHHLLGHLRPDTTITHQDRENEANIFASVITAFLLLQEYERR